MIRILAPLSVALVPLSLAWAGGFAGYADAPAEDPPFPSYSMEGGSPSSRHCEIRIDEGGGTLRLEGFALADEPAAGSYELTVRQGSGSQIVQGGEFSTYPGEAEPLSTVSISASGRFSATLTVFWDNGGAPCTKRVGESGSRFPSFL